MQWKLAKRAAGKGSNVIGRDATFHFATVRGSGHMVPQDQPNKIFELYSRYISQPTELSHGTMVPSMAPSRAPPTSPDDLSSAIVTSSNRAAVAWLTTLGALLLVALVALAWMARVYLSRLWAVWAMPGAAATTAAGAAEVASPMSGLHRGGGGGGRELRDEIPTMHVRRLGEEASL